MTVDPRTTVEDFLWYEIEKAGPQYETVFSVNQCVGRSGVLPTDDIKEQ